MSHSVQVLQLTVYTGELSGSSYSQARLVRFTCSWVAGHTRICEKQTFE